MGFRAVRGIRERKNDGAVDFGGHFANDRFRERRTDGGEPYEDGRSNVVDDIGEAEVGIVGTRPGGDAAEWLRVDALLWGQVRAAGMQQSIAIHHPKPIAGFFFREPFCDERGTEVVSDSRACGTGAEKNDLLLAEWRAGHANRGESRAERDSGGALNVVVEGKHLIAVAIKNGTRVDAGKVFPLEECSGKNFSDGGNKGVDEAVVIGAGDARVAPAEIFRVAQAFLVVRADVQNDGESSPGMNSADEAVERKLADGNAEAADALVTDAENALAVRNNNYINFGIWVVAQKRGNGMAKGIRNEKSAGAAVNVAEFLAAKRDDGSVDDGQHLLNMVEEQAVEEHFISVLKLAEIDVALEVVGLEREGLVGADALIVERFDDRRKQAVQSENRALVLRKGGAFVERRIVQQVHAAEADGTSGFLLGEVVRKHSGEIVSFSCRIAMQGCEH